MQLAIIYCQLRNLMKPCFKCYFLATDIIQVINIFQIGLTNVNTILFLKYDFLI